MIYSNVFQVVFFLCRKDHSSISTDDVLSGAVFEATLSHGTTFRNEISMLKDKVERLRAKDDEMVLIMFYKMQMMNTLCKSFLQKIIRVFMEISGKWKPFVLRSLEEVATSTPGLFLQITEDRQEADVILSDNKERPNLVCISWEKISGRYNAIIEFGHECKLTDIQLQSVATLELLSAIGFHREMLRLYTTLASLPFSYENERSIIQRYDPYSILLNGSNKLMTHKLGRKTWSLEIGGYGQLCRLSELDKVGLNLLFPPCITKSFVPMLSSETKMFYCGRRVMDDHNRPGQSRTDGRCGPSNGANCPACRTLIDKKTGKMLKILTKGKFQGWSGEIYCGKKLSGSTCGPSYGSPCILCCLE